MFFSKGNKDNNDFSKRFKNDAMKESTKRLLEVLKKERYLRKEKELMSKLHQKLAEEKLKFMN